MRTFLSERQLETRGWGKMRYDEPLICKAHSSPDIIRTNISRKKTLSVGICGIHKRVEIGLKKLVESLKKEGHFEGLNVQ